MRVRQHIKHTSKESLWLEETGKCWTPFPQNQRLLFTVARRHISPSWIPSKILTITQEKTDFSEETVFRNYQNNKLQCHGAKWIHYQWEDFLELWVWRTVSVRSQNKTLEDKTVSLLMLQPVVTGLFHKDLGGGKFLFITAVGLSR